MIKFVKLFLWIFLFAPNLEAEINVDLGGVIEIKHMSAAINWSKPITIGGSFRRLPTSIEINKIRFQREETRFFFSIADVGPGWNSFRLIPFLPSDAKLLIKSRREAKLKLGLPMLEIKKDNYWEWRYISIKQNNKCSVMYIAVSFDKDELVKEMRIGKATFSAIETP